LRGLGNHRWLCWTTRHSAFPGQMVARRHITDAGTIALAFVIREFMGNDRGGACHSYEFGHEGGWCWCSSEPPSVSVCGGRVAIGEPNVRCLWRGWCPGSRSSGLARHHERGEQCPTIRLGRPECRCCSNASTRYSRARRPSGMGSLPKPPGSSRGRRRPAGGKLRVATPTRALSPHRGDRDAPTGSLRSLAATAVRLSSGCGSRAMVRPGACSTLTAGTRAARSAPGRS